MAQVVSPARPGARLRKVLSYMEQQVLRRLLVVMQDHDEDTLVSAQLAVEAGATRSVATIALAKAEAAGVIETWSLGSKGTRIRILDRESLEEAVRE